jgi:hypothetical protein
VVHEGQQQFNWPTDRQDYTRSIHSHFFSAHSVPYVGQLGEALHHFAVRVEQTAHQHCTQWLATCVSRWETMCSAQG